jgi:cytochrome P450
MVRHAGEVARRWRDGATVDIEEQMLHLALVVISETMFGADLAPDAHDISTALTDGMDFLMTIMLPFGSWLAKLPIPATRRFLRAQAKLDSTFYRIIEHHEKKEPAEGEMDLLSMLLAARDDEDAAYKMPPRQVRDEVMTIFLTGYETVGTALTWTFYLLSKHPEVQAALQKEIDATLGGRAPAFEDLPKLVYARRVLAESMRLFPPAWAVSRRVLEDVEVAGHTLAEGSIVLASQYVTQRDARFFPDPDRFDPERWNGEAEADRRASYTYFPFGAGGRSCIGERFAWTEATLLLASLSQRFSMRPISDEPPKMMPLISLRPKGGLPLRLEARS